MGYLCARMQMPKDAQHCLRILGSPWKVQVGRLESPLTKCASKEKTWLWKIGVGWPYMLLLRGRRNFVIKRKKLKE